MNCRLITAAGLLRLARLEGTAEAAVWRQQAQQLLDGLTVCCLETDPEAQGLLRKGTYHAHKAWGVEAYFICGDYFFLEALLPLEGRALDFWGPEAKES